MDVGDGDPPWGDGKWGGEVKSIWMSVMETRPGVVGDAFLKGHGVCEDEDEDVDECVYEGSFASHSRGL